MKRVQVPALVEHPGLRRIQILWLCVAHDPPAEADDPAGSIQDRENDPVPELIIHAAPLFINIHQPASPEKVVADPLRLHIPVQAVRRGLRREPKRKCLHGLLRKPPLLQVLQSAPAGRRTQAAVIICPCQPVHLQKLSPLIPALALRVSDLPLRKPDPGPLRQKSHSFQKVHIVVLFHKGDDIAALMTAKAIVHLLWPGDRKRRGFLIVKGAKPHIIASRTLQLYTLADDIHNVVGSAHLIQDLF